LKGLVDVAEEEKRLLKEIAKLDKDIETFSKKLENPSFVDRAPADVVAKEKTKLADAADKKVVLEESLEKIKCLK
jgi:valyl-tRNA synthetase